MIKNKRLSILSTTLVLGALIGFASPLSASAATTSYTNQDFTAYTCPKGGLTASGVSPTPYTTCAVHPSSKTNPRSAPIFPFGSIITTKTPLNLPGYGKKSTFVVQDKGDLKYVKSQYWVDIFFDYETNSKAVPNALKFGDQKVSYTVKK